MLTKHNYCPLPADWDQDILECCPATPVDDPTGGSDCCYDVWKLQLGSVNRNFREADEKAKRLQLQLDSAILLRDRYKTWFEDLLRANDLAGYICQHMEVFSAQVDNICCTTQNGVEAIDILYCMVRDFYIRVDTLKEEYDGLISCINGMNRPELNGGIMDCLKAYLVKLEGVIATRDRIIELLVKAMKAAYQLNAAICSHYGLQKIIYEWQAAFNCKNVPPPDECECKGKHKPKPAEKDCTLRETCELRPALKFQLDDDGYYHDLQQQRQYWDDNIKSLINELVVANKQKEILLTNKENLQKAILEVDPKNKCK